MNRRLRLEILTPEGGRVLDDLVSVSAFLSDGGIGILPGHAPLLGETAPRPILCRFSDGREEEISPGAGIFQVEEGRVTVFTVRPEMDNRPMPLRLLRNLRPPAGEEGADGDEET